MKKIITNEFEIYRDNRKIVVYASERPPFGSKKEGHISFKNQLKTFIQSLTASDGEGITAIYGSDRDGDFIDAENALFYNIGTSAFKYVACSYIGFRALSAKETQDILYKSGKEQFHHYYSYQITSAQESGEYPALQWADMPINNLRGDHKPIEYWKLFRTHISLLELFDAADIKGRFGLDIQICSPEKNTLNLANSMKPLLDGIICAFHRMPSRVTFDTLAELSQRADISVEDLTNTRITILGEEEFLKTYRQGVIWNPQDHRCAQVNMNISYGSSKWAIGGCIYALTGVKGV